MDSIASSVPALSSAITSFACPVIAARFRSAGEHSPLTPFTLEVNDLVRGSQQCSVASPQLCALVEVPAGESVGVGGSQHVVTAHGVKLLLIGMEIGRQRDGSGRDESTVTQ